MVWMFSCFTLSTWASTEQISKPAVIFFGGFRSTPEQMALWKSLAQAHPTYGTKAEFYSAAYPSLKSDSYSAVHDGAALIQGWIKSIDESPARLFILVGHSSGAALATAVAEGVKNPQSIRLIILDADITLNNSKIIAHCWNAEDPKGRPKSYSSLAKRCNFSKTIKIGGCSNPTCLHFYLVNKAAPHLQMNEDNYKDTGYLSLEPNLDWLETF